MKCSACGRKLRSPQSQEVGYGPICYKRLFGSRLRTNDKKGQSSVDEPDNYELPGQINLEDYLQTLLEQQKGGQ